MKRQLSGLIGILAGLGLTFAACAENPVTDGSGTPVAVSAQYAVMNVAIGGDSLVIVQVYDKYHTPLVATITGAASACSPATAADTGTVTVAVDGSYDPVPNTSTRFTITGTHAGRRCVTFSSSGATSATTAVVVD